MSSEVENACAVSNGVGMCRVCHPAGFDGCNTEGRYNAVGCDENSDDTPSALNPSCSDAVVSHENFSEYVNLTVRKQLETNLLPMMAHVKAAFEAVVPVQARSNMSPHQLRYRQLQCHLLLETLHSTDLYNDLLTCVPQRDC